MVATHRFCIDYRELNLVTRDDTFSLPCINDLLDQLGEAAYFSTLDLATGYWQIWVHPNSQEKSGFVTLQGLYVFRVKPFGLTYVPAVLQRVMQCVLMVMKDQILHRRHPSFLMYFWGSYQQPAFSVWMSIVKAGLNLKVAKCHFIQKEVVCLRHIITPRGLKINPRLVAAVQEFPVPRNVLEDCWFLGLNSYYRSFIPQFAKIDQPLHELTWKGVEFL